MTENGWIAIAVLVVVIAAIFLLRKRITYAVFNRDGATLKASVPPSADRQSTISGIVIEDSENVRVGSKGPGSSVKDVSSKNSRDVDVQADGRKR